MEWWVGGSGWVGAAVPLTVDLNSGFSFLTSVKKKKKYK